MTRRMSFEEFLDEPRQGEFLDALRTLPKMPKSEAELAAKANLDEASNALDAAGLLWLVDRPTQVASLPKRGRIVMSKLKADGWRVEAKESGGYRVQLPKEYLK